MVVWAARAVWSPVLTETCLEMVGVSPCPLGMEEVGLPMPVSNTLLTLLEGLDLMRVIFPLTPQSVCLSGLGRLRQEDC